MESLKNIIRKCSKFHLDSNICFKQLWITWMIPSSGRWKSKAIRQTICKFMFCPRSWIWPSFVKVTAGYLLIDWTWHPPSPWGPHELFQINSIHQKRKNPAQFLASLSNFNQTNEIECSIKHFNLNQKQSFIIACKIFVKPMIPPWGLGIFDNRYIELVCIIYSISYGPYVTYNMLILKWPFSSGWASGSSEAIRKRHLLSLSMWWLSEAHCELDTSIGLSTLSFFKEFKSFISLPLWTREPDFNLRG